MFYYPNATQFLTLQTVMGNAIVHLGIVGEKVNNIQRKTQTFYWMLVGSYV